MLNILQVVLISGEKKKSESHCDLTRSTIVTKRANSTRNAVATCVCDHEEVENKSLFRMCAGINHTMDFSSHTMLTCDRGLRNFYLRYRSSRRGHHRKNIPVFFFRTNDGVVFCLLLTLQSNGNRSSLSMTRRRHHHCKTVPCFHVDCLPFVGPERTHYYG